MSGARPPDAIEIRLLGTTWVDRGPRYWVRRAGLVVLWTAVLALSSWFVGIIVDYDAVHAPGPARIVLLTVIAIGVAFSFVWGFSLLRRTDEERALGVPMIMRSRATPESRDRSAWAGVGAGVVRSPLVVFAQIFVVGVLAALVVSLLQKYISIDEFEAVTGKKAPRRVAKPKIRTRIRRR